MVEARQRTAVIGCGRFGRQVVDAWYRVSQPMGTVFSVDVEHPATPEHERPPQLIVGRRTLSRDKENSPSAQELRKATTSASAAIRELLTGNDHLVLVTALGECMGAGGAPIVARVARQLKMSLECLVVASCPGPGRAAWDAHEAFDWLRYLSTTSPWIRRAEAGEELRDRLVPEFVAHLQTARSGTEQT